MCVLLGWSAASHIVLALQNESGLCKLKSTVKSVVSIYLEVKPKSLALTVFVEHHKKKRSSLFCSFSYPSHPFFHLSSSPDLQMNGALCAEIVSCLPNEVSNYEPSYFLCNTGCDRDGEGTDGGGGNSEKEKGKKDFKKEQWMRDGQW